MITKRVRDVWQGLARSPAGSIVLLCAAYVFLASNIDFAPHLAWHDGQRIAQLVLFGTLIGIALFVRGTSAAVAQTWAALPRWSRYALYAAFALGVISALRAPFPRWAMLEWAMLLLLLLVALGVTAARRAGGTAVDHLLVVVLSATAVAYAVKTMVVYGAMLTVGAGYGMGFNVRDLYTGFSNIRFFGHVQTMLLPLLLLPAMCWAKTPWQRVGLAIVPVLWWMLVAASGTRGTWVGLAAGALAVLVFGGVMGRRWLTWHLAALAGGIACYALFILYVPSLLEQPASFLHRANDITSLSAREVIWAASIEFTKAHPLLGIGPMHFAHYGNAVAAHPHNALLQLMSEWGIPAALLFSAVFAAGGLALARRVKQLTAAADQWTALVAVALLASITGAVTQSMVDGVLVMPVSQVTLVLICGWALGLYFAGKPAAAQLLPFEKWLCAALVLLAASAVAWGVWPEIGNLEQREAAYLMSRPPGTILLPRFWAQGWINP